MLCENGRFVDNVLILLAPRAGLVNSRRVHARELPVQDSALMIASKIERAFLPDAGREPLA